MPPLRFPAVGANQPVRGGVQRDVELARLFMCRIIAGTAGLLVVAFGFVYHVSGEPVLDPLWVRAAIATPAAVMLLLSFWSGRARRHLAGFLQVYFYVLVAWFAVLLVVNDGSADYAVGLMYVVFGTGVAYMLLTDSLVRLSIFVSFAIVATAVVLLVPVDVAVSRALVVGCVVGLAIVVILVGYLRHVDVKALRTSEEHLAEAQRIASLGNWEWDLQANRAYWSEEAGRLVGWNDDRPLSLRSVLHRVADGDRRGVLRYAYRLQQGHDLEDADFRVVRPDGEARVLRVRGQCEHDADGHPERLVGTLQDVTQQKEHEAQLIAAKEAAEEMVRLKDTFLTNMSHEVRTPLAGIIGYAQVLAEEVPEEQRDFLQSIEQSGKRLLDTLNGVLDLARLEAEGMEARCEPVRVADVARTVLDELRPLAAEKGLALMLDAPADVEAVADETMLRRILTNLASNAVKFTERGHVAVTVETEDHDVLLRVADTGIGIPPEFLPDLFVEFRQGSGGLARSHDGIGIGLAITRRLVDLMGATIEVETEVGHGTTFTVGLPKAPDPKVKRRRGGAAHGTAEPT